MKTQEKYVFFIVNFEQISYTILVSIFEFEQVTAGVVVVYVSVF